jgi:hypothetical protein
LGINPEGRPVRLLPGNGATGGTMLIDGCFHATWRLKRQEDAATIQIEAHMPTSGSQQCAVAEEAQQLLSLLAPEARNHEVQISTEPRSRRG